MNEKKVLKGRIAQRDESIAELQEQKSVIFANLGQLLVENEKKPTDDLKTLYGAIANLVSDIHDIEGSLRRVLADDDRRRSLDDELKVVSDELKSLHIKQEAASEDVGRAAWDIWKAGRLTDNRYQEALADLVVAEEKLRGAEDSLYRHEQNPGNDKRAENILAKGKTLLLKSRKRIASAAFNRLWGPAGLKLLEIADRSDSAGTPLVSAMATFDALAAQEKELLSKQSLLKGESAAISADIKELPGKGGVKRRQSLLENSLDDKRSGLEEAYRQLGRAWFESSGSEKSPVVLTRRRNEIEDTNRRITEKEEEKAALQARVTLLELESRRIEKKAAFDRLEIEVQQKQAMLKDRKRN